MKWYNWPAKPNNYYVPAYQMAWRLLWFPAFYVLRCLLCGVIAVAWGPDTARFVWRNSG